MHGHFLEGGRSLINTPPNTAAPVHLSTNHAGTFDPQRLATFDLKVQSTIMRLHLRREYVSLGGVLDEIKDWSVIEQLWYLEFIYQQQSGYIDHKARQNYLYSSEE